MATNDEHKALRGDTLQQWGDAFTTKHPTYDDLMDTGFVPQEGMIVPDGAATFFAERAMDALAPAAKLAIRVDDWFLRVWSAAVRLVRWR